MKVILFLLLAYHIKTQQTSKASTITTTLPPPAIASASTSAIKIFLPNAPNQNVNRSNSTVKNVIIALSVNIPIKIPSPLNYPVYNAFQSATTTYHTLLLKKETCTGKNTTTIKNVAIKQHNISYYLTSQQYFLSFKKGNPNAPQIFTAIQNKDCSWSFMSKEGRYISLKPAYSYLMLEPNITSTQKFIFKQKNEFLYIQGASSSLYHWTAANGICRMGQKQGSRFIIQVWPEPRK